MCPLVSTSSWLPVAPVVVSVSARFSHLITHDDRGTPASSFYVA
ncbi:hypothetical protein T08_3842 [Trichinella sp. T8]|nr:hypothetical protein T08_3842 [Trichinella sp. T8]